MTDMHNRELGLQMDEPLIFNRGAPGRRAFIPSPCDVPEVEAEKLIPPDLIREDVDGFPEVSQVELVRHFTRLSQWNMGIDTAFYPLGSCTMKYNPKVNEEAAALHGFSELHPCVDQRDAQGILRLMLELERCLCEISGMSRVALQPAAGAQGELTAMLMIRAYHAGRGDTRRRVILPDSSHGTNPASTALCGYEAETIPSDRRGLVDTAVLRKRLGPDVAALMLTNPNTLGLFERDILEINRLAHEAGTLVHCDGANLNAIVGVCRPGDMGFDTIQFNPHKTFSTPHGGGGPGAGPTGVSETLVPYLPVPTVEMDDGQLRLEYNRPHTIGRVRSFYGNVGVMVRAYAYILALGSEGIRRVAEAAVINANYLLQRLEAKYPPKYGRPCMHEFVLDDSKLAPFGVSTLDVAKRLIDYGFHPPTIYFPLIVSGALMVEPTETETRETLDSFAKALEAIAQEAQKDPEILHQAPHLTRLSRLDETRAARKPILRWTPGLSPSGNDK